MELSTEEFAYQIRRHALVMVHRADSSHIGGALSVADILAVLYGRVLRVRSEDPEWPDRDRLVFSKGHACTALYAALALGGFFPLDELASYGRKGTRLLGHASHEVPGVEWSTGSLGHGLGLACGQALAGKRRSAGWRVFAVLSDDADVGDLKSELGSKLASELNPLFKIHDLVIVDTLPRTASNKLMRRELRARYLK